MVAVQQVRGGKACKTGVGHFSVTERMRTVSGRKGVDTGTVERD